MALGPASLFQSEQVRDLIDHDDRNADECEARTFVPTKKASERLRSFRCFWVRGLGERVFDCPYWHISRNVQPTMWQLSVPFAVITHLRFGRRW